MLDVRITSTNERTYINVLYIHSEGAQATYIYRFHIRINLITTIISDAICRRRFSQFTRTDHFNGNVFFCGTLFSMHLRRITIRTNKYYTNAYIHLVLLFFFIVAG